MVKNLSIPFVVDPNLEDIWEWIRGKIDKKLRKKNKHFLSLAERVQVCQKNLSSYNTYYTLAWLFSKHHFCHIQNMIREFLWLDGKENKKRHCVN